MPILSKMPSRRTLGPRSSGILLPIASIPGGHGIGDLGPEAYRFADFLKRAGQGWWQVLPVGPTLWDHSPYNSPSAFAGNPLLISLDLLAREGLLDRRDLKPSRELSASRVRYDAVREFKRPRLRKAYERFLSSRSRRQETLFRRFCARRRLWLEDYALFASLSAENETLAWTDWEPALRGRRLAALERARLRLSVEIGFRKFEQYVFERQWNGLKAYAARRGIGFIGDLPIFIAHDSADVWAHPELFCLDAAGRPTLQAGVPPDYFSRTGQLWHLPIYRWDVLKRTGYAWWIARLRSELERFDLVRLDHFIGFLRSWAVSAKAKTAVKGRWMAGPKADFFEAVKRRLGSLPFIAEDLGVVTPEVKALRDRFDLPGMRVLQFAFGNDPEAENYRPHRYPRRSVVYTGTHDNDTTVGWFRDRGSDSSSRSRKEIEKERAFALSYLNSDGREIHWDMIRAALGSPADTAIFPVQDVLGLGSEARMNIPGTPDGNWEWRLCVRNLNPILSKRLRFLTETFGRCKKVG